MVQRAGIITLLGASLAACYPVTPRFADHTFSDAEYQTFLKHKQMIYTGETDYIWNHSHYEFFDMFVPTYRCPDKIDRYPGGLVDGGKYVCSGGNLMPRNKCLVYSFGSEGDYKFEAEILRNFGCEIHTFDCFGDYGASAPSGVTFHKWCVGGHDNGRYFRMSTIMNMLGHERVDYVKMDVEGSEFFALPDLLALPRERLPLQFGLEIHAPSALHNQVRNHATLLATIDLMTIFDSLGYRLYSREDNCLNYCCSEFVYILADKVRPELL